MILIVNYPDHKSDIDDFCTQICDALNKANKYCIPSGRTNNYKDHIVPRFNEHVKKLHDIARRNFVAWRSAGKS